MRAPATFPTIVVLLAIATSVSSAAAEAPGKIAIDFEDSKPGEAPAGFRPELTGEGRVGSWQVVEDETAPRGPRVLAQTSADAAKSRYPLCIYETFTAKDLVVSVQFRPVSRNVDQADSIVWRYRDHDNYYVVRANALEDNVVVYKVKDGKRTDLKPAGASFLAYGKKVEVPPDRWSELRLIARGKKHSVHFNGEHLFDVEDETFAEPGRVGLWTKADSVTRFDALVIESLDGAP